jgi:ribosome-associated protein
MSDEARALAVEASRIADHEGATDVVSVLDVADYFVIAGASNRRLVRRVVEEVEARCRERLGRSPVRSEGVREQEWVLLDYGDVVVHVFLEEIRGFYEIERLYGDVDTLDWSPAGSSD